MWIAKKLFPCLVLTIVACAALAPARADCPDQTAVPAPGGETPRGPWQFCPITLTLRDSPIQVLRIPCPAARVTVPSFGLCRPAPGSGTYCHFLADLPVTQRLCQCSAPVQFTPFFQVSTCECGPPLAVSWVQDFDTESC